MRPPPTVRRDAACKGWSVETDKGFAHVNVRVRMGACGCVVLADRRPESVRRFVKEPRRGEERWRRLKEREKRDGERDDGREGGKKDERNEEGKDGTIREREVKSRTLEQSYLFPYHSHQSHPVPMIQIIPFHHACPCSSRLSHPVPLHPSGTGWDVRHPPAIVAMASAGRGPTRGISLWTGARRQTAGITLHSAAAGDDCRSIAADQKNSVIKSAANRPGNQPTGRRPCATVPVKSQTRRPAKRHRRPPARERHRPSRETRAGRREMGDGTGEGEGDGRRGSVVDVRGQRLGQVR